jgi:hypothetical protein
MKKRKESMDKPFFIMLYNQKHTVAFPMTIGGEEINYDDPIFFSTIEEARECAKDHAMAQAFGYEIFEIGMGDV